MRDAHIAAIGLVILKGLSIVCGWTSGIAPRIKLKLSMLCNFSLLDVVYGT